MLPNLISIGEQCESPMSQANKVGKKKFVLYMEEMLSVLLNIFLPYKKNFQNTKDLKCIINILKTQQTILWQLKKEI